MEKRKDASRSAARIDRGRTAGPVFLSATKAPTKDKGICRKMVAADLTVPHKIAVACCKFLASRLLASWRGVGPCQLPLLVPQSSKPPLPCLPWQIGVG